MIIMDKTGLLRKMLSRTYLVKEEAKASGFQAMKNCITLAMQANAAGLMSKLGITYKSANSKFPQNKIP